MNRFQRIVFVALGVAAAVSVAAVAWHHHSQTPSSQLSADRETVLSPPLEPAKIEKSIQTRANEEETLSIPLLIDGDDAAAILPNPKGRVFTTPQGMLRRYQITIPDGWTVVRQEIASVSWWKNGWELLLRNTQDRNTTLLVSLGELHTSRCERHGMLTDTLWQTERGTVGHVLKDYYPDGTFDYMISVPQSALPDRTVGEVCVILDVSADPEGRSPASVAQLKDATQKLFRSLHLLSPRGFAEGMEDTRQRKTP